MPFYYIIFFIMAIPDDKLITVTAIMPVLLFINVMVQVRLWVVDHHFISAIQIIIPELTG
jgi:hypothetical protein